MGWLRMNKKISVPLPATPPYRRKSVPMLSIIRKYWMATNKAVELAVPSPTSLSYRRKPVPILSVIHRYRMAGDEQ
jgi:hypothetical protein